MATGYLYDIAAHFASVTGLKGTYCGDGNGGTVDALPMSLPDTPALVVFDGETGIVSGNAERWQIAPELHLYVSQAEGLGAAWQRAYSFRALLLARSRQSIDSDELVGGSFVPMRFREVEDREWPIGSGRHYWVQPFECQARVNVSTSYFPPS